MKYFYDIFNEIQKKKSTKCCVCMIVFAMTYSKDYVVLACAMYSMVAR